jgi:hypothetical protein
VVGRREEAMGYPFVYALENGEASDEIMDKESAEDLIEEGTLTDSTQCWNEEMDGWTDWSECKAAFGFEPSSPRAEEEEYDYEYYTVLQYQVDGEVSDEIDTADVHSLIEQGQFSDETLVWTEGMDDWYPWAECKVQFGFDADDEQADGGASHVEEWIQGLTEAELKEQCEVAELELDSYDGDSMRDALREMYGGGGGDEEEEDGEVTSLTYEKEDGSYEQDVSLADAWELAEAGTIVDGTLCWAEGLDDWAPWKEAKHLFFDLEEDEEPEAEEGDTPAEGVPPGPSVEETAETAAMREKYAAMRPYQVKSECKKRRLPYDGAKPELIEALIVFEFGGGAAAAKEMAEAAKVKADEEAAAKKEAHHRALIEAQAKEKEEETAYLKRMKAAEAEKATKGKAGAKPEEALQDLGYSSKQVRAALKQAGGDQDAALAALQKSKKHLSAMTDEELTARVDEVMEDIDSYGTGAVGFRQLLSWVRRNQGGARVTDEMLTHGLQLFNQYDVDGSGSLDKEEIREMLLEMEHDQMFSKIIASFLDHEDADPKKAATKILTLEEIATINKIPEFIEGAEELMMDYIEAELRTLNIPSIKGKQSWGVYELLNIEPKKYDVKAEKMTVDPSGRYRVMSESKARETESKGSAQIGTLKPGTIVKVLESKEVDGQTRIRCRSGWLSPIAVDGTVLLQKEECIVVHVADIHCLFKNFKCKKQARETQQSRRRLHNTNTTHRYHQSMA